MADNNYKCLSDILTEEEIKQMSSYVRIKLESHLEGRQLSIDNMKNQLANSVANAEKKNFAVERELQNTKSKLNMAEDFADKLKNQLREAEEALQKSRHDYYETLQCKESLTYELNAVKEKMERFSNEKLDLSELLERRLDEIKSLQMEIKSVSSKLHSNSEGRIETSIKAEEMELRMISIQHQDMRMSQERQLYQKQIQTLTDELNQKVNELLVFRRERTTQLFELQSNLEQKTEEHLKCIDEIKHLKQILDKKDKHIDSLATRIREMQQYSAQLEEDYQNEISAQNNLIELHKQSSLDYKKRNETLVQTIEEMQRLLQAAKQAHNELEATFNETQIKYTEQINKYIEENNALIKELEEIKESTANTSRENIEAEFEKQYPLAATTKKLLRNNMSFTQIFNELVRAQQELEDQKSENSVLKEHLQQLATEAEDNTPLLHRKIQEHQRALQNISELQTQISSLLTEREQWLQEKDTLIRMNKQFEREIKRYEKENIDLAKQIRALIKSVQEARGFTVSHEQDSQISSSDNNRNVPQELVTFRDIVELQTKNQQLMNALREANEKLQKFEEEGTDEQRFALQRDLDEALVQLENLRTERRQQTEMVEALVQQRDLYKMIASHSNDPNQVQRSPVAFTSSPFSSAPRISVEEHNELKSNLDKINKEYAEFREQSSKRSKELSDNNEKLREEISNARIETAKISSELTFTQERLEIFKTNMEQFQRENALLRERNTILNENVKKHEQSLVLMRQEVLSAQDKVTRLESDLEILKSERDLLRNNELKLLQEKDIMIRNQENQNKLINTLQSVQSNLNRMESEAIVNLKSRNDKLEKECAYLKSRYDKESERHSEASILWEKHSQDLQTRIDNEIEKYLKVNQELAEYQTKVQRLENELNSLRNGSNQQRIDDISDSDRALHMQINVMREQYSEAQNEIKLLRNKLTNAQKACDSLRTINSALEEKLNEHKLSTEEIQVNANSILTEKDNQISALKKELLDFKDRYQKAREEKTSLENEQKNVSQQYLERINKLTLSLIDANSRAEKASLNEKRVLEDRNNQMAIAAEAQANYERELQQRSNDAQMNNTLRKQLEVLQNKVIEAESAAKKAQEQLAQSHQIWDNERKQFDSNQEKVKEKCLDLERINDTLNQQLELLNNRIIALQNNSSLPLLSKDEAVENTNRLLEVIKFLRKEKEILQTQVSALESEDSRLKAVVENLKKELIHTQNDLKEEKIQSKTMITNASQHNELVKKIEMINILSESNALLRNEKNSLEVKCQELSLKLENIGNQNQSKEIEDLMIKIESKTAENLALREELKHWQTRTNNLMEKLNKTSPEDLKRLNEERNKLQQQISNSTQEFNRINSELEAQKTARKNLETQIQTIKSELESKNCEISKLSNEINSCRSENVTTQNTIIQLRKVARKYKLQFDEMKIEFDKLKDNENKSNVSSNTAEANDNKDTTQESQSVELLQKIEESNNKVQELNEQIEKLKSDFVQINDEKEAAKLQASEKEEKAKKIAHQAKQRLALLSTEKSNLLKDKEVAEKRVEEMSEKIKIMEQNAEESALRLASIKSQCDAKLSRQERELLDAYKQIEDFKLKLQSSQQIQSQQQLQQQTSAAIGVTAPVQASSQSSSAPVRHSVHPQQSLSAKSTPTASIRPLAVAPTHVHRTPRASNVSQSRTANVAAVQPTTEESNSHQSVPHATVQPTQTVTSQMAFVPPTSSSDTEMITAHNEDDSFEDSNTRESNAMIQTQRLEQSAEMPEVSGTCFDNNNLIPQESEAFTKEDIHQLLPFTQTREEEPESSTSIQNKDKIALKRTRQNSSEDMTPFSTKKGRIESEYEGVRPQKENVSHQELLTSDKSSDSSLQPTSQSMNSEIISKDIPQNKLEKEVIKTNVYEDDDEVIILESDESDDEQKVQSERENEEEEEEEDEEEDYDDSPEDDENVDDGSEEVYEREDFNEEMSEGSHYEEGPNDEQLDDNNDRNDEEIEIIGVSDDIQEQNQDLIDEQLSGISHQQSIRTEPISSEQSDPNVSTTISSLQVTSNVTSSTESVPIGSNPFIQVPTPIQRSFATGRQSFYISHAQQSSAYDEGDGIVPSTPTLFVPRRGDSFAEALNSPRVPQGRFVFSSSIPEASALSQLASEGTLGVDDTRMDLSQFDDNGRSVPTTPLAVSPAIDSGIQLGQSGDEVVEPYDTNVVIETPISSEFDNENRDSSRSNVETDDGENSKTSLKDNNNVSSFDLIDTNEGIEEEVSEQPDNETDIQNEEEEKEASDQNIFGQESDAVASTSTSGNTQRHAQTARRGRSFGPQRGPIQRRPIVWPTESSGESSPNKQSTGQNISQVQQQPQSSHQSGRRIRLRGASSKFSTRGDYRGGRPGRGSRGTYHYSKQ